MISLTKVKKLTVIITILAILLSGCTNKDISNDKKNDNNSTTSSSIVSLENNLNKHIQKNALLKKSEAETNLYKKSSNIYVYKILDYSTTTNNNNINCGVITYKDENDQICFKTITDSSVYMFEDLNEIKGNYLLEKSVNDQDYCYIVSKQTEEKVAKIQ